MNTSNKLLVGLLALQIVVLVGLNTSGGSSNRLAIAAITDLYPKLDIAQVNALEIFGATDSKTQEHIKLERNGDTWVIPAADNYPAKKEDIELLLNKLVALKSRNRVLTASTYHKKLEVSEDTYRRKLVMTTSDGEQILYLGSSPSFKNIHVRRGEDEAVYQVADLSESDAGARSWNWVDRKYVDIPKEEVWSVVLKNEHGEIQLDRDPASNTWALVGETKELDSSAIDSIVNDARDIGLETPVGKTAKPEFKLGEVAKLSLTVGTSTIADTPPQATKTVSLMIGTKIEDENRHYLKASTSEYVVEVAEWELQKLIDAKRDELIKQDEDKAEDEGEQAAGSPPSSPATVPAKPRSLPKAPVAPKPTKAPAPEPSKPPVPSAKPVAPPAPEPPKPAEAPPKAKVGTPPPSTPDAKPTTAPPADKADTGASAVTKTPAPTE